MRIIAFSIPQSIHNLEMNIWKAIKHTNSDLLLSFETDSAHRSAFNSQVLYQLLDDLKW